MLYKGIISGNKHSRPQVEASLEDCEVRTKTIYSNGNLQYKTKLGNSFISLWLAQNFIFILQCDDLYIMNYQNHAISLDVPAPLLSLLICAPTINIDA